MRAVKWKTQLTLSSIVPRLQSMSVNGHPEPPGHAAAAAELHGDRGQAQHRPHGASHSTLLRKHDIPGAARSHRLYQNI